MCARLNSGSNEVTSEAEAGQQKNGEVDLQNKAEAGLHKNAGTETQTRVTGEATPTSLETTEKSCCCYTSDNQMIWFFNMIFHFLCILTGQFFVKSDRENEGTNVIGH